MIKNIKSLKKLFILSGLSAVLSAYVLGTGSTLLPPSINSSALAENPNNLQVDFREFGSTMNYDRAKGTCTVISKSRELVQTVICMTLLIIKRSHFLVYSDPRLLQEVGDLVSQMTR
jgi:hypothetical protein